jgi:hypothetical protein
LLKGEKLMGDVTRVWKAGAAAIRKYPHLLPAITDAFDLMRDEVADGSSDELEQERFLEQLDYLIAKEKS